MKVYTKLVDNGVRVVNYATSENISQKDNVPTSQHPEIYLDIYRWENTESHCPYSDK
jgi:uncharacterized Zn-finger protein